MFQEVHYGKSVAFFSMATKMYKIKMTYFSTVMYELSFIFYLNFLSFFL